MLYFNTLPVFYADGIIQGNLKAPMIIITQMAGEDEGTLKIRSRVFLPDAASVEDPVVSIFMLQPVGWAGRSSNRPS